MTYDEAIAYMSRLHRFGIKLGNDRIAALLRRLGDPHRRYGIAHVTGTKGKGSTTAMIAAILTAHGFRTGGYFSPYVYDVRERVQLDGAMIDPADLARIVTNLVPHIEELAQGPLGQTTEFELKTALGFTYFAEKHADFAAIEVGIGGRLDATNVVEPLVSVITNVGLDHTDVLGSTHCQIAREKAGIIKPGRPVITAVDEPSARQVILEEAGRRDSPLIEVIESADSPSPHRITWQDADGVFRVVTQNRAYEELTLGLMGHHQGANAACAIGAVEAIAAACGFQVRDEAVRTALASLTLPGRFSVLCERPTVIADGAHNALSARVLSVEVRKRLRGRLLLVVGMLRGHEPESFVAELAPYAAVTYATQPLWKRAEAAEVVAGAARKYCADVRIIRPPLDAARAALDSAEPDDTVLITGSFYTVGDAPPERLFSPQSAVPAGDPAPERQP